jgi:TonB family protein
MQRKILYGFIFWVSFLTSISAPCADDLKDALNQRLKNQILALRSPFVHGEQKFDATGHPLGTPSGSWLVYGSIFISKVSLSPEALRLEGPRVAIAEDRKTGNTSAVPLGNIVAVEIRLDQPLTSVAEAAALLNRVFFLDDDRLAHARPEYRRADVSTIEQPLYHVGEGKSDVKPPAPIHTPEPDYSEIARRKRVQGTLMLNVLVDKTGQIVRIRIQRPLGMGLDEQAVNALKTWRFKPATRNGEPIPVEMNIEISFKLG